MSFSIETFVGLHVYLISAHLIYNILDRFMISFYDNLLSPFVNILVGKNLFEKLKWQIEKEEDIIDLGEIIAETVKLTIFVLLSYNVYKYFKKHKKLK